MAELNTDVRFVRGVGEARAKSLAKLGITDLKSLISYFPRAYEDRRASRLFEVGKILQCNRKGGSVSAPA